MKTSSIVLVFFLAIAGALLFGCLGGPAGGRGEGEACSSIKDCSTDLVCLNYKCAKPPAGAMGTLTPSPTVTAGGDELPPNPPEETATPTVAATVSGGEEPPAPPA